MRIGAQALDSSVLPVAGRKQPLFRIHHDSSLNMLKSPSENYNITIFHAGIIRIPMNPPSFPHLSQYEII